MKTLKDLIIEKEKEFNELLSYIENQTGVSERKRLQDAFSFAYDSGKESEKIK